MMINSNYAQQVEQARSNNELRVNFEKNTPAVDPIPGQKDTVTLSDKALAMMNGQSIQDSVPTYIKPTTARSMLAEQNVLQKTNSDEKLESTDTRFSDMMQHIIDQRLGVDRKKLDELDAMMEEIAKNPNMSPEEKQKALEEIAKMKEKVIEESREVRDFSKLNE